ncbi:class D beta-lactamase [Acinetobacter pragensis]|uniref:Class D beta-lactamase n=1 Tax=Acinetobacter pragensis TaxID=1806892 RepID=A0A151Y3Q6_9GAMM|nr:class D beta-lactamase [Acinetobacter pragensis]KYQ72607.1 class D beta-lactamase [Acinetobacter pragensis]
MNPLIKYCAIVCPIILLGACTTSPFSHNQAHSAYASHLADAATIRNLFNQANVKGVIIIKNGNDLQEHGNAVQRADQQFIPASTFKMLNALIGIEHNKTSPDEIFKWNGEKRSFPAWEKDLTLAQAMAASAVPVYQELARRIGLELMQNEVKRVQFGNGDIGTQVDNFWLIGPLKITPKQEVQFADQLSHLQLPFSKITQQQVVKMLFIEQIGNKALYAKSGWGMDIEPQVGWYTGWVEDAQGRTTAFSLNLEMDPSTPASIRKELVISSLKQLKIL